MRFHEIYRHIDIDGSWFAHLFELQWFKKKAIQNHVSTWTNSSIKNPEEKIIIIAKLSEVDA